MRTFQKSAFFCLIWSTEMRRSFFVVSTYGFFVLRGFGRALSRKSVDRARLCENYQLFRSRSLARTIVNAAVRRTPLPTQNGTPLGCRLVGGGDLAGSGGRNAANDSLRFVFPLRLARTTHRNGSSVNTSAHAKRHPLWGAVWWAEVDLNHRSL